jgi:hypothetical protein
MFGQAAFGEVSFGDRAPQRFSFIGEADLDINFRYTLRAATRRLFTAADDIPARTPVSGILASYEFERSIIGSGGFGPFVEGRGTVGLTDVAGDFDFLPQQYSVSGRPVRLRLGRYGDRVRDHLTLLNAVASDFDFDEKLLKILVEDNGYRFEVPFQTRLYGGTGGADGTADLAGKPIPRALGFNRDVTGPLVDPALLITQVHDGEMRAFNAVKVRRAPLTFTADYPSYAALTAAPLSSGTGTYATCKAAGCHRLSDKPSGEVTADIEGDNAGGVFASTTGSIVRRIIKTSTAIADPAGLYLPAFAALELAQPAAVGIYAGHNDNWTVADAVARLLRPVRGWIGDRRDGKIDIGIFGPPVGPPVLHLTERDIPPNGVTRQKLPEGLSPPPALWRIGYARNNTPVTEIADIVSAEERAFALEQYRYAVAESAQTRIDYPNARQPEPVEGYFRDPGPAQTEADERLEVFRRTRALYNIKTYLKAYKINIGEVIHVTWPRWDLKVGRLLRIVATKDSNEKTELVGYG